MDRKYKIIFFTTILVFIITVFLLIYFIPSVSFSQYAKQMFLIDTEYNNKTGKWFVKINDKYRITRENIERDKSALINSLTAGSNTKGNKGDKQFDEKFLENTLNQHLIIIDAVEKGIIGDSRFNDYLWLSVKDAVVKYYLLKKLESEKKSGEIIVDNNKVQELYKKNKVIYEHLGFSKEKAYQNIKSILIKERKTERIKKLEQSVINELKLKYKIEFSK